MADDVSYLHALLVDVTSFASTVRRLRDPDGWISLTDLVDFLPGAENVRNAALDLGCAPSDRINLPRFGEKIRKRLLAARKAHALASIQALAPHLKDVNVLVALVGSYLNNDIQPQGF